MPFIQWKNSAFDRLECLPQQQAFDVLHHLLLLEKFPFLGAVLPFTHPELGNCPQLNVGRSYRVIYEFDESIDEVWILFVQHVREQRPSGEQVRRLKHD